MDFRLLQRVAASSLPAALAAGPDFAAAQYTTPTTPSYSTPLPRHSIREDKAGSNTREAVVTWHLPFNKRYAELTLEQKKLFKSNYAAMDEADEPPFPADGLETLYRKLHELQGILRVEGELDMDVEVAPNGKARAVSVRRSPSPEITQAAAAILMFEPYKPAICGGKPCAMMFPVRVTFRLK